MASAPRITPTAHGRRRRRAPLLLALAVVAGALLVRSSHAWVRPSVLVASGRQPAAAAAPGAAALVRSIGTTVGLQRRRLVERASTMSAAAAAAAEGAQAGGGASKAYDVDVAIIGGGPAGSVMAALLAQQHGLQVLLMDPKLDQRWIPNYGVWLEEWQALERTLGFSLEHCLMKVWPNTDLFCGGSHGIPIDERLRVKRPYGRVDRVALKAELRQRALAGGATLLPTAVDPTSVQHSTHGTSLTCEDGTRVKARMLLDCAGYSSQLVQLDGAHDPGVQVAYGIEAECDACPYDEDAMTLMDYRTDCFADAEGEGELNDRALAGQDPTFMYAMPMGPSEDGQRRRVFFEETSLVARPPMSFDECKRRMEARLKHLGVQVLAVEEEEFCYIPMGGALPKREQRVVAFGGALGLVHPSTGYQICRAMAAAGPTAKAIARELKAPNAAYDPDIAARRVYDSVWSHKMRLQRDFAVFGGEFLMAQDAGNLRGFFDSFFRLPVPQWAGFLAGWPGLPNNAAHESWAARLEFGIRLFLLAPLPLKLALAYAGVTQGGLPFFRSVTPLADLLPPYPPATTEEEEEGGGSSGPGGSSGSEKAGAAASSSVGAEAAAREKEVVRR